MATLLVNLRGVPDDEADEIRGLLERNGMAFYETPPNRWGITAGAIWLRHDEQLAQARRLLAEYQEERRLRARAEHDERRRAGRLETLASRFRQQPLVSTIYLAIVVGLAYFTIRPFFAFGG